MITSDLPRIRRLCWLIRAAGSVFLLFVLASYLATWIWPDLALWNQPWARIRAHRGPRAERGQRSRTG